MNLKIKLILAILLSASTCGAQNRFKEGSVKAGSTTFEVKNGTSAFMSIKNENNPTSNAATIRNSERLSQALYKDDSALANSFYKVFTKQRLHDLLPEINIVITYSINRRGKPEYIDFNLRKTTLIIATGLERLEAALKSNVIFIIPKGEGKTDNIYPITQFVFFKKLYENYHMD